MQIHLNHDRKSWPELFRARQSCTTRRQRAIILSVCVKYYSGYPQCILLAHWAVFTKKTAFLNDMFFLREYEKAVFHTQISPTTRHFPGHEEFYYKSNFFTLMFSAMISGSSQMDSMKKTCNKEEHFTQSTLHSFPNSVAHCLCNGSCSHSKGCINIWLSLFLVCLLSDIPARIGNG